LDELNNALAAGSSVQAEPFSAEEAFAPPAGSPLGYQVAVGVLAGVLGIVAVTLLLLFIIRRRDSKAKRAHQYIQSSQMDDSKIEAEPKFPPARHSPPELRGPPLAPPTRRDYEETSPAARGDAGPSYAAGSRSLGSANRGFHGDGADAYEMAPRSLTGSYPPSRNADRGYLDEDFRPPSTRESPPNVRPLKTSPTLGHPTRGSPPLSSAPSARASPPAPSPTHLTRNRKKAPNPEAIPQRPILRSKEDSPTLSLRDTSLRSESSSDPPEPVPQAPVEAPEVEEPTEDKEDDSRKKSVAFKVLVTAKEIPAREAGAPGEERASGGEVAQQEQF